MKRVLHKEKSWIFPFISYEPETKGGKLPLVIQLHGAGERGNGQDELDRVEVWGFPKLAKEGEYPCLFVFPQCPEDTFWVARVESILRFIDQLKESYDIDEDRIYLTGLSMGGYGTWYTAMAAPDRFAAIAPVCGGGMAWNADMLSMPVWAFHGAQDTAVYPDESQKMVDRINILGGNAKLTIYPECEHDSWTKTYSNPDVFKWLLEHKNENTKEIINMYNNSKDFG